MLFTFKLHQFWFMGGWWATFSNKFVKYTQLGDNFGWVRQLTTDECNFVQFGLLHYRACIAPSLHCRYTQSPCHIFGRRKGVPRLPFGPTFKTCNGCSYYAPKKNSGRVVANWAARVVSWESGHYLLLVGHWPDYVAVGGLLCRMR